MKILDLSPEQLAQEVTLVLPLSAVLRLGESERALRTEALATATGARVAFHEDFAPEIGAEWLGGKFAGLSLHEGKPVALILLPGERDDITWKDALAWAEEQGGVLPSRIDQLVLLQNLKPEFKQEAYWSCEQNADDERYAWYQYFSWGPQSYCGKDNTLRARAVRRVTI